MTRPLFEIVRTTTGAVSIRNNVVNEIMHNPVGPWVEANSLYIEQSDLRARLLEPRMDELVIFDVGLGAAANALAALHCAAELGPKRRPLKIVSFEKDLDLLRFALDHADQFDHFKGYEIAITQLLDYGLWSSDSVSWLLRTGDFVEMIEHESEIAHLIFYDPYSPQMNKEMWSLQCFKSLRGKSHPNEADFFTYSRATPIRSALLAAGFFVGCGKATGLKDETTQASTWKARLHAPLDKKWLSRWERSSAPYPFDCEDGDIRERVRRLILEHDQFKE